MGMACSHDPCGPPGAKPASREPPRQVGARQPVAGRAGTAALHGVGRQRRDVAQHAGGGDALRRGHRGTRARRGSGRQGEPREQDDGESGLQTERSGHGTSPVIRGRGRAEFGGRAAAYAPDADPSTRAGTGAPKHASRRGPRTRAGPGSSDPGPAAENLSGYFSSTIFRSWTTLPTCSR